MSNESKEIKITDKRMFTAEGELREEYRFLAEKSTDEGSDENTAAAVPAVPAVPANVPPPGRSAPAATAPSPAVSGAPGSSGSSGFAPEPSARLEIPGSPPGLGASLYDLVAMLAEPIAIYLGDVDLPDGQSAENLEMARLHIDLLDVLRQKTAGNLSAHESAFIEDLLYRSRLRYVQKRG